MSWSVRLKEIVDDASNFDTVKLIVQYYNKQKFDQNFTETYSFTIDDRWEDIRDIVLKKLEILNVFRRKVEELFTQIGVIIDPAQAVTLGLKTEKPTIKTPPEPATELNLTAQPPIPKQ